MLDLRSYIVNDELVIEEPQWHVLNESYSRDEIKEAISEVIQDLPLPLLEFTEEEETLGKEMLNKFGLKDKDKFVLVLNNVV